MNSTFELISLIIGSGATGSLIVALLNKGKTRAETQNIISNTYGDLIDELRQSIKYQGDQIKALQDRELQYLKIISGHQQTEWELKQQIKSLEVKLETRMGKLEDIQNL
jgi:hypothetical protein